MGGPGGDDVVGGDEAERGVAGALHAPGQEHAEGLVGVAALEAVGDEVPAAVAGEGFHQQVVGAGEFGAFGLQGEPFADGFGKEVPGVLVVQHACGRGRRGWW